MEKSMSIHQSSMSHKILLSWWITSTQSFVDEAGSENALTNLRPYFVHSGKAGAHVLSNLTKVHPTNLETVYELVFDVGNLALSQGISHVERSSIDSLSIDVSGCITEGRCKEACICFCGYTGCSAIEELYPISESMLTKYLGNGDDHCTWITKRSKPLKDGASEKAVYIPKTDIDELRSYLGKAYLGESWVNVTRGILDYFGPERAEEILVERFKKLGASTSNELIDNFNLDRNSLDLAGKLVFCLNDALDIRSKNNNYSGQGNDNMIIECPFKDTPRAICLQHEAFLKGLCSVIDDKIEIEIKRPSTQSMAGNHSNCHWIINRKKGSDRRTIGKDGPPNDPISRLMNKYVDGEITEEEFERMMTTLKRYMSQ